MVFGEDTGEDIGGMETNTKIINGMETNTMIKKIIITTIEEGNIEAEEMNSKDKMIIEMSTCVIAKMSRETKPSPHKIGGTHIKNIPSHYNFK